MKVAITKESKQYITLEEAPIARKQWKRLETIISKIEELQKLNTEP